MQFCSRIRYWILSKNYLYSISKRLQSSRHHHRATLLRNRLSRFQWELRGYFWFLIVYFKSGISARLRKQWGRSTDCTTLRLRLASPKGSTRLRSGTLFRSGGGFEDGWKKTLFFSAILKSLLKNEVRVPERKERSDCSRRVVPSVARPPLYQSVVKGPWA